MGNQTDLAVYRLGCLLFAVVFPIALIVFALSGLDVRQRSGKAACEKGELAQCLSVAKFYEDRSDGLFGFLLSNNETAMVHYDRACTLGSMPACARLGKLTFHGADQAADSKFSFADGLRAYEKACAAHLTDACFELGTLYLDPYRTHVDEVRAGQAFAEACDGGSGPSCYQIGLFYQHGRGGYPVDAGTALEIFDRTCAQYGTGDACAARFVFDKKGALP